MIAIIHDRQYVLGYHPSPDVEGFDELGTQYDMLEEVPEIILNTPPGSIVRRITVGEYELEALPPPVPVPEDRITQLENESAMLALELVDTQIRLDQAETEQAALLLELIDKGGL
ncbi:hypothetical protein [Cohnella sp.]|uniref:hypothetical protein n=1 Tax=Cohnella sp. TaxID=1883426 RepID=UPI003569B30F